MTTKVVQPNEIKDMLQQLADVPIFGVSEKITMLQDKGTAELDPNIIMNARHKIFQEPLQFSPAQDAILAEAKRLLISEEVQTLYQKRGQRILESELKKFEKTLSESRPRCSMGNACNRKVLANSSNSEFWKIVSHKDQKKDLLIPRKKVINKLVNNERADGNNVNQDNKSCLGSIKVTIKDKPMSEIKEQNAKTLRICFDALKLYAYEQQRLRNIKNTVQGKIARRRLQRYFEMWRSHVNTTKVLARKKSASSNTLDEHKIELFLSAITEKQKQLTKMQKLSERKSATQIQHSKCSDISQKIQGGRRSGTEAIENRLNAQKKIIAEQRMKLAEQNRIIEEMKLQQLQNDTRNAGKETLNAVKETLVHCGRKTRRSLIHLMLEEGYRDKVLEAAPRLPTPPQFLLRMEARAEARRERIKRAEEARARKLEEQRKIEEAKKTEEEENRKKAQQEALKDARRLHEEQEKRRAKEAEKSKKLNATADQFYRKYLLRRYIMDPLILLIEMKYDYIKKAQKCYTQILLRRVFKAWHAETLRQGRIKMELVITVHERNMLWHALIHWRKLTKLETQKYQTAIDFHDMRVMVRCMKVWYNRTLESKMEELKKQRLAEEKYEQTLKQKYFKMLKKYLQIAGEIEESERRRDKWRELVQRVVPDFDPKQRGVAIDY
ncbi:caldesmon isoform X2 [Orussus abietinus]|nr:caldesmon isoform X2 [Orussus abietinus]XP_012285672.1 caldesmon isoform X2 [Orussus abietinus]XP_012285673.1 caldesmon isoform X2 [Orussus abietinus]